MINKVIISGGGTGGHIFPALAIAKTLVSENPNCEILFIGANGRMEMTMMPKAGFQIIGLDIEGIDRKRFWRNVKVISKYLRAIISARDIIQDFKPDICIGVGGYVSAPTLKAAQMLGIPTIIQEQNSYAGLTNKRISKGVNKVCVAYPDMQKYFPKDKIVLTGNPIRPEIEFSRVSRADAISYFKFPQDTNKVVLIIGGSLGALTINESIGSNLDNIISADISIIWQTGRNFIDKAKALVEPYKDKIFVSPFIDRMDLAYCLANIVVSRSGASSISELEILGKPSILVPSPNVAEDHQTKNALALSKRNAAILVTDKESRSLLSSRIIDLMNNEEEKAILSREISKMATRNSAQKIVEEVKKILK